MPRFQSMEKIFSFLIHYLTSNIYLKTSARNQNTKIVNDFSIATTVLLSQLYHGNCYVRFVQFSAV